MTQQGSDGKQNFGAFTNQAGETYRIRGLSPTMPEAIRQTVIEKFKKAGNFPIIPTYTVETATGETEVHPHDETTLVVEGDEVATKENQQVWAEYKAKNSAMEAEYNARLMKAVFLSVQVEPSQDWVEEMAALEIPIPEDKVQRRYKFVELRVIQSPKDLADLMVAVFRLSGMVKEEQVKQVEATFQRAMEEAFAQAGVAGGKAG